MALTDEQLQAIRERAERATPGPWMPETSLSYDDCVHYTVRTVEKWPEHPHSPRYIVWLNGSLWSDAPPQRVLRHPKWTLCKECGIGRYRSREVGVDVRRDAEIEADASFISHAREDVPALLAEVERLRAEVARLSRPSIEVCDMRDARQSNPDLVPKPWGWSVEKRVMLTHGWADTEAEARAAAEKACQP